MNKTGKYIQDHDQLLSIYFTADFPDKGSTLAIIPALQEAGVDMIEVGIPFSDPLADGPDIQQSSQQALQNGFSLERLFEDLKSLQEQITIPLVPMGYFNTALAYGLERFLGDCQNIGADTVILPDLPLDIYEATYADTFAKYKVSPVFLMTPQTSDERIKKIDRLSNAFIYAVADNSITGSKKDFSKKQLAYFERIKNLDLSVPVVIGFGIANHDSYMKACEYAQGAIVGSAFIRAIKYATDVPTATKEFVQSIKSPHHDYSA